MLLMLMAGGTCICYVKIELKIAHQNKLRTIQEHVLKTQQTNKTKQTTVFPKTTTKIARE